MDLPAFADDSWTRHGRELQVKTAEVTFIARSHWYTPGRWTVTGTSPLALPAAITIYVARSGPAYGYWRNAPPGLSKYFGYCDAPALMSILVGPKTRRAISAHDGRRSQLETDEPRETVELHVHGGNVETTTTVDSDNRHVIEDQLAIHRGLAEDHADLLASWQAAADRLGGSLATRWPPVLDVPRSHGATTIALRWSSSTAPGSEAAIELVADARGAKLWSLELEPRATPNSIRLGGREFLVMGDIPLPRDQLAKLIARADILSIIVRRHVTVTIARSTPDVDMLEALLDLIGALVNAPSEPYR